MERRAAEALDAGDPLRGIVDRFAIDDPGLCYLDGNSLGRLPLATRARLRDVIDREWGSGLVRSWPDWIDGPLEVGDRLGRTLLGAAPGQTLIADSVTVNLYKLAAAVLSEATTADPDRRVLVTTDDEFPTDRYVLDGVARQYGGKLRVVPADPVHGLDPERLAAAVGSDTAVVSLSLVSYRSASLLDLASVTDIVHRAGAHMLWDLSHAVGSVPVDLDGAEVDLAVGCTYKYVNAGPGAPGFLYVARRHQARLRSPIQGWFAQRDQFAMGADFAPVDHVGRFATGTPSVIGLAAVDEGVKVHAEAGIDRVRAKGVGLTSLLVDLADAWLAPLGFEVASPREATRRGAHVALRHPEAERIVAALIAEAGVVGDFRGPDRVRLGPAPLTTRFVEVWDALDHIRDLVAAGRHLSHDRPEPSEPSR
ncbi:MAG: aminotransferase class V-fold PLP-dependent enzyme [Acidimicrobiales bacterium]